MLRRLVVVLALFAFAVSIAVSPGAARAAGDMTGSWYIAFQHPYFPGEVVQCLALIEQQDALLTADYVCSDAPGIEVWDGSLDKKAMSFLLGGTESTGATLGLGGVLSEDGASASGGWTASTIPPELGAGTFEAERSNARWGDADCGGGADSIDALLVLHGVAGLIALPCAGFADVDLDEAVGAGDALLILQLEAGLLEKLPVVGDA